MDDPTAGLPHAHGGPAATGLIKVAPEDFLVEEILGFEPSGEGEHVFLRIEKCGENTEYLARRLARFAGVPVRNVGYAGLKDRHGRTIQWYSVQLPGQEEPDWRELDSDSLRILDVGRNARKLRKGAAAGNRFALVIRALRGDRDLLEQRLHQTAEQGVPNYFGAQRFGWEGQNLTQARALFGGHLGRLDPHRRGLYLSAARAEIFNRQLAERVTQGTWNQAIGGDVFMFQGSGSFFAPEALTPEFLQRVAEQNVHPSGVLWGAGVSTTSGEAARVEQAVAAELADLCRGLERCGLELARRPFRLCPEALQWEFPEPDTLRLGFILTAGAYATAVLRESIATDFVSG